MERKIYKIRIYFRYLFIAKKNVPFGNVPLWLYKLRIMFRRF